MNTVWFYYAGESTPFEFSLSSTQATNVLNSFNEYLTAVGSGPASPLLVVASGYTVNMSLIWMIAVK